MASEEELGPKAIGSAELDVIIGYRDKPQKLSFSCNEAAVVDHARSAPDLPAVVAKVISSEKTVVDLLDGVPADLGTKRGPEQLPPQGPQHRRIPRGRGVATWSSAGSSSPTR
ncbi:hypothetical protein ACFPC0_01330 [Streptomyces andamanensis]|uniref:Uncharacterized protein n=1 Tax=Streptomyces andamanensis TaxID=1565035 RepID=A0ABV8T6U7_9ACTN